jgi:hypothetical protein
VRERDNGSVVRSCLSGSTWQPLNAAQSTVNASQPAHRPEGRGTDGSVVV